jgi:alpha-ketoglutarate-dependent taurine dioxygenase
MVQHLDYCWKSLPNLAEVSLDIGKDESDRLLEAVKDQGEIFSEPNNIEINEKEVAALRAVFANLKKSPGFVLLRAEAGFNDDELRRLYALISRTIGKLNQRYGYFFDVVDQGLNYTKEAIPVSKTKASTGYHTDSTAKDYVPDVVGLLCLNAGYKGGESLVTNAANAYEMLKIQFPECLNELEKPVIRDVITPGSEYNKEAILRNAFPIYNTENNEFLFRYMRYWIESAHSKTGLPISSQLIQGMDAIDDFFSKEENTIQFKMERGDMLFLNNRFLCHNRSAFEDHPSVGRRMMVRTWINFEDSTEQ